MRWGVVCVLGVLALFLAATPSKPLPVVFGRQPAVIPRFQGAHPSYAWRDGGNLRRLITFPTPIQHVVVIVMENRTVDNLFAGYYNVLYAPGLRWGQALNLYDPSATPTLAPWGLEAPFDPDHAHETAFKTEALGDWHAERFGCRHRCPRGTTARAYVSPISEVAPYAQLIKSFAFARSVFQSNEGPSFPAHQYLVAGQAGGAATPTSPLAFAENPHGSRQFSRPGVSPLLENGDVVEPAGFCGRSRAFVASLNMYRPYSQNDNQNKDIAPPCEEYPTILDEVASHFGGNAYEDWQYVAHSAGSIWAAPMAVRHLAEAYENAPQKQTEPFAVDGNARQFVRNIQSPRPTRPFANLTYITPCLDQSDHPSHRKNSDGPKFVGYVVNAIGTSRYWMNTTVIVVWDDWGGWFDHARLSPWPYHPRYNTYRNNPSDPNEWGFRVPMIVISPYVVRRGYVSARTRSFGAILQYVEDTFSLPSLKADDYYHNDNLGDIFDYGRSPLPYYQVNIGSYQPPSC
jgi:phospholipase C